MPLLSIIVLTRDEEVNLPNLLASTRDLDADIIVVDSGSTDRTRELAANAGCAVHQNPWVDHSATQFNWALDHVQLNAPWVMRLDADERLTPELVQELTATLPQLPPDVTGILIKRQVWFWGRWIKHGDYYPTWLLRVWRTGRGRVEQRFQDAHVMVDEGEIVRARHDIIDENLKGMSAWTIKHNRYSDREVKAFLGGEDVRADAEQLFPEAGRKRWLKTNLYYRMPIFLRPLLYWLYRYIIRLGFLDGVPGLVFHLLQGFFYRFLVDAKIYEQQLKLKERCEPRVGGCV